jgi:recombination associated protein RdgC
MLFKTVKFAKLLKFDIDYDSLQSKLKDLNYVPATPNQESSVGWVSPFGDDADVMTLSQGKAHFLKLKIEEKKVPASAIKNELELKIKALREKDPAIKVSKSEKNSMKEEIKFSLLPKVLPSYSYIDCYVDIENELLVVNTTSDKKWEVITGRLGDILGDDFEFEYFTPETDTSDAMTYWISEWDIPTGFQAGDECKLKDMGEEKTEITYKKHDLNDEKIQNYLSSMKVIKVAMELTDEISFLIDAAMCLSGVKFLDVYKEKRKEDLASNEDESRAHAIELDVDFAIMRGAFKDFLPKVVGMFKEY